MDTEYERKYSSALAELEASPIWASNSLPPAHKFARQLGFRAKPPHYNSFAANAFSGFVFFAPAWGILMWFLHWSDDSMSLIAAVVGSASAGLIFGLLMAAYYSWSSRKHQLSDWSDL